MCAASKTVIMAISLLQDKRRGFLLVERAKSLVGSPALFLTEHN